MNADTKRQRAEPYSSPHHTVTQKPGFHLVDGKATKRRGGFASLLVGTIVVVGSLALVVYAGQVKAEPPNDGISSLAGASVWASGIVVMIALLLLGRLISSRKPSYETENSLKAAQLNDSATNATGGREPFSSEPYMPEPDEFSTLLARYWRNGTSQSSYLALSIVQIDNFRDLTDKFGQDEMRQRRQHVTWSLHSLIESRGGLFCPSGTANEEDFLALLPNSSPDEALTVSEEMRLAVEDLGFPARPDNRGVMTASLGLAVVVPDDKSSQEVLRSSALQALEHARRLGGNRVSIEMPRAGSGA